MTFIYTIYKVAGKCVADRHYSMLSSNEIMQSVENILGID